MAQHGSVSEPLQPCEEMFGSDLRLKAEEVQEARALFDDYGFFVQSRSK